MPGCSACAAGSTPRRLNSSCTENDEVHRRRRRARPERARHLEHHRAAGAVVDRRPGDAPARQLDRARPVDDGRADLDAGGARRVGAVEARVDRELPLRHAPGTSPPASVAWWLLLPMTAGMSRPSPTQTSTSCAASARSGTPPSRSTCRKPSGVIFAPRSRAGPYARTASPTAPAVPAASPSGCRARRCGARPPACRAPPRSADAPGPRDR